jgi:hypothetical protein
MLCPSAALHVDLTTASPVAAAARALIETVLAKPLVAQLSRLASRQAKRAEWKLRPPHAAVLALLLDVHAAAARSVAHVHFVDCAGA